MNHPNPHEDNNNIIIYKSGKTVNLKAVKNTTSKITKLKILMKQKE